MSINEAIYRGKATPEAQVTQRMHSHGTILGKVTPTPKVSGIMRLADQLMHE